MHKAQSRPRPAVIWRRVSALSLATLLAAAALVSLVPATVSADGNDSIYLTPNGGSFTVGQRFKVEIRENSNGEAINAVQVELGFPANMLEVWGIDHPGSDFDVDAQRTAASGTAIVAKGTTTPFTGDKLVARVEFKVIAAGSINIQVRDNSVLVSSQGNKNIVDSRVGANIVGVSAPRPGPPGPPGTPGASPSPQPIPTTRPIPVPSPGSSPNVTITPSPTPATPSPQPIILPDESEIEVDQPAIIETTPSTEKAVTKVEYSINGKVVRTVSDPPYSYSVETGNLRNGTYTLTVKTYYDDGTTDSTDSQLLVKNPLNATQLMLQLKHYAWLVILLILIIAGAIGFLIFRKRGGGGGDEFGGDFGSYPSDPNSQYGAPGASSVITPAPGQQPYDPNNPNGTPPAAPPGGNPYGSY